MGCAPVARPAFYISAIKSEKMRQESAVRLIPRLWERAKARPHIGREFTA